MSTSVEISTAAPTSATELAPASHPDPNGGKGPSMSAVQGLDIWLENFRKYEATLKEVNKTSGETKFGAELATIEQWFKFLSEPERTASVYALLLHSNQDQIRFFISVLQQMIRPDIAKPNETPDDQTKPKQNIRSVRPPSLNLPLPGSPTTPRFNTPVAVKDTTSVLHNKQNESSQIPSGQVTEIHLDNQTTLADALKLNNTTDAVNISASAQNDQDDKDAENATQSTPTLPGLGMMSPFHLNMLANAGLSTEAQLLAVQLVMSGLVQPTAAAPSPRQAQGKKPSHLGEPKNWRTPTSAKYPGSALRSGLRTSTLKSASLKSAGLQSAGLQSAGLPSSGLDSASLPTPREEDFDPEMLNDIPAWLRSLRLHKYTSCFDGLTWQEMVVLDDATLESKGIAALGARRRLLRTFEHVQKRMGMESPSSATPTTSALNPNTYNPPAIDDVKVPQSAAPTSKLSINSPIFTPASERGPQSAAPTVSITPPTDLALV